MRLLAQQHELYLPFIYVRLIFCVFFSMSVINELRGLARGDGDRDTEHHRRVTAAAKLSVEFLEESFTLRNPRVKTITSKGTVLDTMNFTSESAAEHVS